MAHVFPYHRQITPEIVQALRPFEVWKCAECGTESRFAVMSVFWTVVAHKERGMRRLWQKEFTAEKRTRIIMKYLMR